MSVLVAKKASLNVMRECQGANCSCFTSKGYYIQYRTGVVDSMLFVCEDCFNNQYSSKCSIGSFNESDYLSASRKRSYYCTNPTLRKMLLRLRKAIRISRIVCILFFAVLIAGYSFERKPQVREYYTVPSIHLELNTDVHDVDCLSQSIQKIIERITTVINHNGGNEHD